MKAASSTDGSVPVRCLTGNSFADLPASVESGTPDVAILGVPFSSGVTGAQLAPAAIRAASKGVRPTNAALRQNALRHCRAVDCGDIPVVPGMIECTYDEIVKGMKPFVDSGVMTLCMGGDHTVTLGEVRALHSRYGKLGFVLFDAHHDVYDSYADGRVRFNAGTHLRRAIEEGLVDPARTIIVGLRTYRDADDNAEKLGVSVMTIEEVVSAPPSATIERIHQRVSGGPAFLSFDIDVMDPAYAPGTGSQVPGGLTSREALALIRGLDGRLFVGFDVVEVNPALDPSQTTAHLAAHIIFEFIALTAYGGKERIRPS
jgi:agmatinase